MERGVEFKGHWLYHGRVSCISRTCSFYLSGIAVVLLVLEDERLGSGA
jgi:hypothetical protein